MIVSVWGMLSAVLTGTIIAAPALAAPLIDTEATSNPAHLIQIQFALLHSTSQEALNTEKWNNTQADRALALSELELREHADGSIRPKVSLPDTLLSLLQPLTRSGEYEVIYATKWIQPSSLNQKTYFFDHDIQTMPPFDFVYGQLKLTQRVALVSQLEVTMLARDSLLSEEEQSLPREQYTYQPGPLAEGDQTSHLELISQNLVDLEQEQPPARIPIIYLRQRQQVRLDQIIYFDHPITPGFLLVSELKSQPVTPS